MLQNRFKFNLRFKSVGEFAARLCALLIYAVGARLMGADGFGLFSLAFSYSMLATVIIDSGTINIITRDIARDKESALPLIQTFTTYKLLVAPVAVVLVCLVASRLDETMSRGLLFATGFAAAGTALNEHLSAILSGFERMKMEAAVKIINRAGAFVLSVALFYVWPSVTGFTMGMALGVWVSVVVGFVWLGIRLKTYRLTIRGHVLRTGLRTGIPMLLAWLFITLYTNQDRYILSMLNFSTREIGIYSASLKLIDALRPIPVLLMGAVFPIVSEASVKNPQLFEKIAGTLVKYSVIALFPFAFFVSVFSPWIIRIVFGPEFSLTAGVLSVAIWGYAGIFINHLFLYLLVSADQQKKFLQGAIVLMAVNAPVCWILFRTSGLVGGAWALIASEVALLLFNVIASPWSRKQTHVLFGKPLALAAASMGLFLLLRVWLPSAPAFAGAVALYGVLVWRSSLVDLSLLRRFVV